MNWKDHLDSKYFQLGNQTAGQFFFSRLFYFIGLKKMPPGIVTYVSPEFFFFFR